jgi:hypothetical protein
VPLQHDDADPGTMSSAEKLSYYLVEKLGEAAAGAGIPALVLVILTLILSNKPTGCIYAGLIGSLLLPALHLLRRQSIPGLHHGLRAAEDEIVYVIISLIVGFLIGAAGYAIKGQLMNPRPPAQQDDPSRSVAPANSRSILSKTGSRGWHQDPDIVAAGIVILFVGGVFLWQQGAPEYIFSAKQTLRCEGAPDAAGTVNLLITTGWFTTPTISLHANNSVYDFDIVEASSVRYSAKDRLKDDIAGTLNIDRLSGRLKWRWSSLQKGPPENDYDCFLAGIAPEYCGSYKKGTHTKGENTYTCRAAAPKF